MPNTTAYKAGRRLGKQMAKARTAGDDSYDCRWDLAYAAKQGKEFFADFKHGLEDGLKVKES